MRFARLRVALGFATAMGAAACSFVGESTDASNDDITAGGDVSQVLKSTLVLETGCMAVKSGPKQLVLAARCVVGNATIGVGKSVGFTLASGTTVLASAPKDAGAGKDAGAPTTLRKVTIASVDVHPSFLSKCSDDSCGFDTLAASDAKDIAVLTLTDELDTITTIPVDLDMVGQSDPLLAVSSGCTSFSAKAGTATTTKTLAVPPKLVNHDGSPYLTAPALVTRLGAGYVVTPAWRTTDERLCATNIGAPLFRATRAVVAGITSNFTAYDMTSPVPVTVHHTRVDISSKVGPWLQDLGVVTIRTCSNDPGGCIKRAYDGGAPKGERVITSEATTPTSLSTDAGGADGGDARDASTGLPDQGEETALSPSESDSDPSGSRFNSGPDEGTNGTDTTPTKKTKAAASGCSAAPGSSVPGSSGFAGLLGVALALGALRRRR